MDRLGRTSSAKYWEWDRCRLAACVFTTQKGFGFLSKDDSDAEVFCARFGAACRRSRRSTGSVEFGVIDGKREQALNLTLLDPPPSLSKASRKSAEQMAIVEDLIASSLYFVPVCRLVLRSDTY